MSMTPEEDAENAKAIRSNLGMPEAFTDEDLAWWKKEHQSPMSQALLARLEAAERVCGAFNDVEHDRCSIKSCLACDLEAWKQSKGA